MKYFRIKDNDTLELFIVDCEIQPENSVLVTDKNSNFIKPKANDVVFTEVVESATEEDIEIEETPISLLEKIDSLQNEINILKNLLKNE